MALLGREGTVDEMVLLGYSPKFVDWLLAEMKRCWNLSTRRRGTIGYYGLTSLQAQNVTAVLL